MKEDPAARPSGGRVPRSAEDLGEDARFKASRTDPAPERIKIPNEIKGLHKSFYIYGLFKAKASFVSHITLACDFGRAGLSRNLLEYYYCEAGLPRVVREGSSSRRNREPTVVCVL